jgi:chitodextrinase
MGQTPQTTSSYGNLTCGTAYQVGVDAYDAAGNRSSRADLDVTTSPCPDTEPPTAPSNVTASNRTTTSVALTWAASTDNVGVAGYGIYNGADLADTTVGTTGIVAGLVCGTSYTISVDAFDVSGNSSAKTAVMVSTLPCVDTTPPTQPTNLRATSATPTGVTLAWTASTDNVGVVGYDVLRAGTKVGSSTTPQYVMNGLTCGTTYSVGVRALDAAGNPSPQATFSTATAACTTTCPSGQVGTPPDCYPAPPAAASSGKRWEIAFNEDFSGSTLDLSKLTPCFDWNYGNCTASFNHGKERYLPSQVQVSNGTAKLVAEPLCPPYANSACYQGQCTYKAGLVSTARPRADNGSAYLFTFTYGYVESRMKFPGTPGFFTAFWMLPADPTFNNYPTEIDIVEILGGFPDTIFMNYHYNNRSIDFTPNTALHNNGACQVRDYSTDFVRFGLDWEPNFVAWYIDGVKCGQFNGNTTTVENGPMQLILHMMVDNDWERSWNSVLSSQTLVRQLEVDYIRVYQQR